MDAPNIVKQKTLVVIRPHTLEHIQAIADANGVGGMLHATGGKHLNSDDYFKSRALIKRRICIKELEKEKEEIEERMNRANERDLLIQEKGKNLTQETKKDFKLPDIKILLKWKFSKIPLGNKAALIQLYLDTPDPEEITAWSEAQANKLLTVK